MGLLRRASVIAYLVVQSLAQSTTSSATPIPTPYEHLPPAPKFSDGGFLNPNTSFTQIFTEGSKINITWRTKYEAINLFFGVAGRGDYDHPITVTTGQSRPWFEYELQCRDHNCTLPHRFRAVDTYGSKQDHLSGGFTTGEFWIAPRDSTTSSAVSSTSTPSSSPASTSTASASSGAGSSSNSTAIGVGVGVGVGGAILVLGGILTFLARRRKHKRQNDAQEEQSTEYRPVEQHMPLGTDRKEPLHEGDGTQVYEAYAPNARFEAPTQVNPSELP